MNKLLSFFTFVSLILFTNAYGGAFSAIKGEATIIKTFTPLMVLVKEGNQQKVDSMIRKGVNINERNKEGVSALMIAAYEGHGKIVKKLLDKGAEINNASKSNNTALSYAAAKDHWNVVNVLLDYKADVKIIRVMNANDDVPIINAVYANRVDIVKRLISAGASTNIESFYGWRTPLEISVMRGYPELVKVLLAAGADPQVAANKNSFDNRSALWHARKKGHTSTIKLIKDALAYKPKLSASSITADFLIKQVFSDGTIQISKEGKIIEKFLMGLQAKEIKLIRNAIFARKNYKFSTPWITDYFEKHFPSYDPKSTKVSMTKIDKDNVRYLKKIETKKQ